jgi:hypothetical protein
MTDCSTALKEWAVICRALETGRQTLLLRKGGIAEGAGGFRAEHNCFWLYPTQFHQSAEQLAPEFASLLSDVDQLRTGDGRIVVRSFAIVEQVEYITSLEQALSLRGLHGWSDAVVEQRFNYKKPGLYLFVVRIFAATNSTAVTESATMAGCKSWVQLPAAIAADELTPVMDDALFAQTVAEIQRRLAVA